LTGFTWAAAAGVMFLRARSRIAAPGSGGPAWRRPRTKAEPRLQAALPETHDFQAPRFYERLGFEAVGLRLPARLRTDLVPEAPRPLTGKRLHTSLVPSRTAIEPHLPPERRRLHEARGEWPVPGPSATLAARAASDPGRVLYVIGDERFPAGDVLARSERLASGLLRLGIAAGDVVPGSSPTGSRA
jgi:hypothetical protein